MCKNKFDKNPIQLGFLQQMSKEISVLSFMEHITTKDKNNRKVSYLVPTRVEEVLKFDYITVF
jgi:hypothetical protein